MTPLSALSMISTILTRQVRSTVGRRIAYVPVFLNASSGLLDRVDGFVARKELRVHLAAAYPFTLEAVLEVINLSKKGRTVGKITFLISGADR